MARELIGQSAAANDRELIGRFLRHAYPLGLASFNGLLTSQKTKENAKEQRRR